MPVTTVYEKDCPELRKHKIRLSGQVGALQAKPQALAMACAAHTHFRLSVAAANPRHVVRTSCAVMYVHAL